MTTMAALLGGVPMMVGTGVGSEIRQPLVTPSSVALLCRRYSRSIRRRLSISIWTDCRPGCSENGKSRQPPVTRSLRRPNEI